MLDLMKSDDLSPADTQMGYYPISGCDDIEKYHDLLVWMYVVDLNRTTGGKA